MRGIGDPRAIAVLASLPERRLRGCAILSPKFSFRSSYSGSAGRGGAGRGGIGSRHPNDGATFGKGAPQEDIAEHSESNTPADDVTSGKFVEWRNSAQTQNRVRSDFAPRRNEVGATGRGRGIPLPPQQQQRQDAATEEESPRVRPTDQFGRGRGISPVPPVDSGRGRWIPPPSPALRPGGIVGRGTPLGGNADVPEPQNAAGMDVSEHKVDSIQIGSGQGSDIQQPLLNATEEPGRSAVEELLARLGRNEPQVSLNRQDVATEEESPRVKPIDQFGRGRGISPVPPRDSGRGRRIPPPSPPLRSGGSAGRGIPLGGNADVPDSQNAAGRDASEHQVDAFQNGSGQGSDLHQPLLNATEEPKKSAVEELLARLGQNEPQVSLNPGPSAPVVKPKLPFRMPFARLPSPSEQQQQRQPSAPSPSESGFQAQPPTPLGPLGRGRGQPGPVMEPAIGAEREGTQTSPKRFDRVPDGTRRDPPSPPRPPRPPSPPRMQLSVEEARARAIAILEKGLEKNVAAEGERRRKAGMEKFADATEFLADRFNRTPGSSQMSQPQKSRNDGQRSGAESRRRDRPRRPRSDDVAMTVTESGEQTQLTPDQEAQLLRRQEQDTFKDRLHTLFLTQFEPEFAMEEFGRNPDIDEPPVLSLEEYLQSHKSIFLDEDAELSQEQKWQEAVKTSLANAPNLEKLVEAYAGPGRLTSRQQIEKLHTITQKLPSTVPPEVAAFTQRAFITLQNNPRLNMHQKEKLMTNIVTGFS